MRSLFTVTIIRKLAVFSICTATMAVVAGWPARQQATGSAPGSFPASHNGTISPAGTITVNSLADVMNSGERNSKFKSLHWNKNMPTFEQQEIALLKSRVSRLEARLEYVYRRLGVTFVEDVHPANDPQVIESLKANNMLAAIKFYRLRTNASLEEAKAAIEEMRGRLGI
jgi:hypothetical protein